MTTITIDGVALEFTPREISEIIICLWMGQSEGFDEPSTRTLCAALEPIPPEGWDYRDFNWQTGKRESQ